MGNQCNVGLRSLSSFKVMLKVATQKRDLYLVNGKGRFGSEAAGPAPGPIRGSTSVVRSRDNSVATIPISLPHAYSNSARNRYNYLQNQVGVVQHRIHLASHLFKKVTAQSVDGCAATAKRIGIQRMATCNARLDR